MRLRSPARLHWAPLPLLPPGFPLSDSLDHLVVVVAVVGADRRGLPVPHAIQTVVTVQFRDLLQPTLVLPHADDDGFPLHSFPHEMEAILLRGQELPPVPVPSGG